MHSVSLYEETIFLWGLTALLSIFTAVFLFLIVYQVLVGPLGEDPAPNWFFLFMSLLFLFMAINFRALSIKMTARSVIVGYGIFKRTIFWDNIERCYVDEVSSIRYGGWGIRIGRVKGKWRLVYNVIGGPRVVLSLKRGRFGEFVFSTRNPDEVMRVVRHMTGRMA
ncbi:MAG: hypothetical protein EFT35_02970 [Methanophagales archaeon ANME-1-THS]|nr:MAG: hypothetical protein EFT35_02970 [Methanophagales archaeon ANME-1-THS]